MLIFESTKVFALDDHTFDIPNTATGSEEAFNQLMNGESTITSQDGETESADMQLTDSQEEALANGLKDTGGIIPNTINLILSSVALGKIQNFLDGIQPTEYFTIGKLLTNQYLLFDINLFEETPEGPNSELSNILKENVAVWYVAIRNIAAIGCAITLLYVGIRAAISATAEDSAKYKKMLVSWLAGAILLFIMQYIINLMIFVSNTLVEFIGKAITNSSETTDIETAMLSGLAKSTASSDMWQGIVYFVLNCILVFYELKFFVIYLFRVLKIFILTIISPLICITYPIDFIGDGKAQAFNNWFRDIMVLIFIQPLHLVLYIVFIYSAGEIAKQLPIIGILFIVLLDNAEKIVKSALKISGGSVDKGLKDIKLPRKGK